MKNVNVVLYYVVPTMAEIGSLASKIEVLFYCRKSRVFQNQGISLSQFHFRIYLDFRECRTPFGKEVGVMHTF